MAFAAAACARVLLASSAASFSSDARSAFTLALVGLAAISAKVLGGAVTARVTATVGGEVGCDLRLRVLDGWLHEVSRARARHPDHGRAVHQPNPARGAAGEGAAGSTRALSAMTSDVREVERGLSSGVLGSVRALAQLMPLVGLLFWLSPSLAGWAAVAMGTFGWALGRARSALKRAHAQAAAKADALLEASNEAVRHADVWATYGAGERVRAQVAELGRSWTSQVATLELFAAALSGASELLAGLSLVAVLGLARAGVLGSPSGMLVPFAITFFLAYRPLRELGEARGSLLRAESSYARLSPWLGARPRAESPAPDRGAWPMASLQVRGLELPYGALGPVSLEVAPGEIVVVSGPTGIGKSTLLRALLGLEGASAGYVYYAGNDISHAAAGPSARPFAWVPQDAPLLMGTLVDNVSLGVPDGECEPDGRTRDALGSIGASRLSRELGATRLLGERALSGGERQWVALARALATNLPVLLLDEPTTGLDSASRDMVLSAIDKLRGKRSVVLVTHQEEPRAIADRVVLLG